MDILCGSKINSAQVCSCYLRCHILSRLNIYIYAVKEAAALAVDFYMIAALLCLGVSAVDYASIIFLIKLQALRIDNL